MNLLLSVVYGLDVDNRRQYVDNSDVSVDNRSRLKRAGEIRAALLENVDEHPADLITFVAGRFNVSRQAVHRQAARLVAEGGLVVSGQRRHARYSKARIERTAHLVLDGTVEEDRVWESFALPVLGQIKPNVQLICQHGFTEMVNNVIDHADATMLTVAVELGPREVALSVFDNGVGIFNKIQHACGLENPEQAIFELSKGKLTTDPAHHSGEGIFFTSRIFDRFSILSGGLYFGHTREKRDWLMNDFDENRNGTAVFMSIALDSEHTTLEVFEEYSTTQDGMTFDKTVVALDLAKTGALVSRSQAKRVLSRLSDFREAVLDFKDVPEIGQAFADEIFRVYRNANANVSLTYINANENVARMIRRASTAGVRQAIQNSPLGVQMRALLLQPDFITLSDDEKWNRLRPTVAATEQESQLKSWDTASADVKTAMLTFLSEMTKVPYDPNE